MPAKDKTGERFGRLVVLRREPNRRVELGPYWLCRCDCGNEKVMRGGSLGKDTFSCGCWSREIRKAANVELMQRRAVQRAAGLCTDQHPEHGIWTAMVARCSNPNHAAYANYGGRGISVCPEWAESFWVFLRDVGKRPSPELTLDRIDNDDNYEPGNMRWTTRKEQSLNSRRVRFRDIDGNKVTMTSCAHFLAMSRSTLDWFLFRAVKKTTTI